MSRSGVNEMQVWIVIKDLYGNDLETDLGRVDHTSEIVGIFTNEREAEDYRDAMLNKSELPIFPNGEDVDPYTTYIDGIVESCEVTVNEFAENELICENCVFYRKGIGYCFCPSCGLQEKSGSSAGCKHYINHFGKRYDNYHFCKVCGEVVYDGMIDPCGFDCEYVHEECFKKYMDDTYGNGKWKPTDDGEDDGAGGYYLYLDDDEWEATGIYYTTFWDE